MPKRRAHGEGSIRQRPDGRWEARYTEPETGKRRSVYGDTQRSCRDALRAVLRRLEEGKPAQGSRETLRSFLLPADWNAEGLVFPSEAGTRLWAGNLRATFKRQLRAAGLRPIRFHDLRHTCASYLLNEGVPLKQVSDILGHAQTSTTSEIYWHSANEAQRGALDKAEGLAGKQGGAGSASGSNSTESR